METKGEIHISPKYHKNDYLGLNLRQNSSQEKWNAAVEILRDRIYGRYFNQIDMLSADINANGFTIMALNCLLIETLYQFKEGKKRTPSDNKANYATFLNTEFPKDFDDQHIAERFYSDIRCGILHSAQTQNESRLSDCTDKATKLDGTTLIVSVSRVTQILKIYFDGYTNKLLDENEFDLRNNFIKKMKYVCRT